MLRRCSSFICVVLLLVLAWPVAAQDTPALRLDAQPMGDGTYRPGSWLPIRITVANEGRDVQALVSIKAGATYEAVLALPGGAHKSVTIYTRPTSGFRSNAVVRALVNGTEVTKLDLPLQSVSTTTRVFGVLSAQPMAVPLPTKRGLRFQAVTLTLADLPERTEGLSLFDVLLIDGAPLGTLTPQQGEALTNWVLGGGQVVIGGDQLAATLAQLPDPLRVAAANGAARDLTPTVIAPLQVALPTTPLVPGEGARVLDGVGSDVVAIQQGIGKGRVTVVGFPMSTPQLAQLPAEAGFWDRVATIRTLPANMPPEFLSGDMRTEQLSYALTQLPTLALPPLGLLAGLLGAYLLIIGPGLYFVLRRWDRQAWAWVAIPGATLVFSAIAYGYALQLRGNDIILNQISIVEPVGDRSLVQTLGGVFSPRTQTYTLHSNDDILFRPINTSMMGGGPGMSSSATSQFGQTPATVKELKVVQWAMSSVAADQIVAGAPLQATIELHDNLLRGEVRNTGTEPITGLVLVQNTRIAHIGDLQPGETRAVELNVDTAAPNMWGEPLSWRILRGDQPANNQQGIDQPPMGLPPQMFMRDAVLNAVINGPFGNSMVTAPVLLGWMDTSPMQLAVDAERAQHQQLTLINMPVTPQYPADGRITLPSGWMTSNVEASSRNGGYCSTPGGSMGFYAESGMITTTLQLPRDLIDVQIDAAKLHSFTDGSNPDGVKLSIYDWSANAWSDLPEMNMSGGTQPLDQPARFRGPDGTFQLRTDLDGATNSFGCIGLDLSIEGTQP